MLAATSYATPTNLHIIATASDGSVYFGGSFDGALDLDGVALTGKSALFVARFGPTKTAWAKAYDTGFSGTRLLGLAPSADGVRLFTHFGSTLDLGGTKYTNNPPDFGVVIALDGGGNLVVGADPPALGGFSAGGAFDDRATVLGGTGYGKLGPRITSFDPAAAKPGASALACTSFTKDIVVRALVRDGAGNALVGGTYDVQGPTSGSLTVVIPTAFVVRMKVP